MAYECRDMYVSDLDATRRAQNLKKMKTKIKSKNERLALDLAKTTKAEVHCLFSITPC